jgi:glutamyl-tRNA synthetase
MVDDYEMGITHVFRGQEWLGTFPLHVNIIRAFGWPEPVWCHLSVFLNPSGKGKMSKRNLKSEQAIFVLEMRDQGYIPEAVNAWIALMGASFGAEEELLTLEEMAQRFSIDHLNPSASRVNFEKLDDFNGKWIRRLSPDDLASRVQPFFTKAGYTTDIETLRKIAPLIQERIVTLDDAVEMAGFFFKPEIALKRDDLIGKGLDAAQSAAALTRALALFTAAPDFAHATLETPMRALAEELGMKPGLLFGMVRSAVTGQTVSPPLFECMEVIGRATCLARMQKAIDLLG